MTWSNGKKPKAADQRRTPIIPSPDHRIFFVTGVVGAGKSTLIEPLRTRLGPRYDIRDGDEGGVPDNVHLDGQWGIKQRRRFLELARENLKSGIETVICGLFLPDEEERAFAKIILLDLDESALRRRLSQRYSDPANVRELTRMRGITVEESIRENMGSLPWLRSLCVEYGAGVIDASDSTPENAAERVSAWIEKNAT